MGIRAKRRTPGRSCLCASSDDEENRSNTDAPSCCDRNKCITAFGWVFDFFTVAISITDVISDILVAIQFYRDGHTLFAWLVFGAFLNSSVVYAALLVLTMFDKYTSNFNGKDGNHIFPKWVLHLPKIVQFLMVLPVSQLAPSGMYFLQMFILPYLRRKSSSPGGMYAASERTPLADDLLRNRKLSDGAAPAVVDVEEAEEVQGTYTVVGRLMDAIERQVVTHGMLFAETIVESIPQSIIQLIAITFLGEPSTLQVVSMALSILSVVSKAYFLSLSYHVRVFIFKFALLSFDVMSMFYVFSTVFSQDRRLQVGLFGSDSIRISYLSYAWFIKLVAMTCATVTILGFGIIVAIIVDRMERNECCNGSFSLSCRDIRHMCYAVFGVVLSVIPAVLVQESAKLSWIVFFMLRWEPPYREMPAASIIASFVNRAGSDENERRERIIHLLLEFYWRGNAFEKYNNLVDRFEVAVPFLYRHIDHLCRVEDAFLQAYTNSPTCVRIIREEKRQQQQQGNASLPTSSSTSSFNLSNRIRRSFANRPKVFDVDAHPLGYLELRRSSWRLSDDDLIVERAIAAVSRQVLQDSDPKRASLANAASVNGVLPVDYARPMTGSRSLGSVHSRRHPSSVDFHEVCTAALRDGDVHEILAEYRRVCRHLARVELLGDMGASLTNGDDEAIDFAAPSTREAQVNGPDEKAPETNDREHRDNSLAMVASLTTAQGTKDKMVRRGFSDAYDVPESLQTKPISVPIEILSGVSSDQRLHKWIFERVFHCDRLAFFFRFVHRAEPPIDFYQPDGYNADVTVNPLAILFWLWFPINAIGNCAFSVGFVFVSYIYDYPSQNLLQQFCFWSCVVFLVLAALQLDAVVTYVRHIQPIATLCEVMPSGSRQLSALQDSIVAYYDVAPSALLADVVPDHLLAEDLRDLVASYLGNEFDCSLLSTTECLELKRRHRKHM